MKAEKIMIKLSSAEEVKKFCNAASYACESDIDIISGRYTIDGKSIMGIFSLDLSKPVEIKCRFDEDVEKLRKLVPDIFI